MTPAHDAPLVLGRRVSRRGSSGGGASRLRPARSSSTASSSSPSSAGSSSPSRLARRRPDASEVDGARLAAAARGRGAGRAGRAGGALPEAKARRRSTSAPSEDEILYRRGRPPRPPRPGNRRHRPPARRAGKWLFLAEEDGAARLAPVRRGRPLRAFFGGEDRERWAVGEARPASSTSTTTGATLSPRGRSVTARAPAIPRPARPRPSRGSSTPTAPGSPPPSAQASPRRSRRRRSIAGAARSPRPSGGTSSASSSVGPARLRVRLDEVRGAVLEAYGLFRRQEAVAAFLQAAFSRYRVEVDGQPLDRFTPSRRVAFRSVSSGED